LYPLEEAQKVKNMGDNQMAKIGRIFVRVFEDDESQRMQSCTSIDKKQLLANIE
jgi:hypothetical protein